MDCGSGHNIVLLETSQTGQTQDFAEKHNKIAVLYYSYYTILSKTCNNIDEKQPPKFRKFLLL